MPKVNYCAKTTNNNSSIDESHLTTINNHEVSEIMDNLSPLNNGNSHDYQEINLDQDDLTANLTILQQATGINSNVIVNRILEESLLDCSGNFNLIKLFRNILQEEKVKINEERLKALEAAKAQKLIEMKELEIKQLNYSLLSL